ncbi:molybdopterin converting factor subunit 1 [Paraglaciecola sp. L1A13]|uniref:molybdopterin converting factor subunit 1 n=1 Tax=Paraglaciecola sp. L1A13 TaxID=2686359 RepID=UPI00131DCF93|nr:molybdopterin converting factor subunit 1 [Paraglaciecola sp. L1A13]
MINVLFFGQLREQLKTDKLSLDTVPNVKALKILLVQRGIIWQEFLASDSILVAVNQTISSDQTVLSDGDEIAFFPPVTGG